jgi:pantoate--beta-alanine ligase
MRVVTTHRELDAALRAMPRSVLVPTMGALHEGHASLIRQASSLADAHRLDGGCVVSIFVNPTQFTEPADYQRYPKTLEADIALCAANGARWIFAPDASVVYPPGERVVAPPLPVQATKPGLEDRVRPGHFEGVCQVVLRLFRLIAPKAAVLGEKDWQQLQVIRAMTLEQGLSIEVIPGETVREPDGLAMSSRNRFLSVSDRQRAQALSRALRAAASRATPAQAELAMARELAAAEITPDYAVVRDAETLLETVPGRPMRAIIAGRVGSVRLLDNAPWPGA